MVGPTFTHRYPLAKDEERRRGSQGNLKQEFQKKYAQKKPGGHIPLTPEMQKNWKKYVSASAVTMYKRPFEIKLQPVNPRKYPVAKTQKHTTALRPPPPLLKRDER